MSQKVNRKVFLGSHAKPLVSDRFEVASLPLFKHLIDCGQALPKYQVFKTKIPKQQEHKVAKMSKAFLQSKSCAAACKGTHNTMQLMLAALLGR